MKNGGASTGHTEQVTHYCEISDEVVGSSVPNLCSISGESGCNVNKIGQSQAGDGDEGHSMESLLPANSYEYHTIGDDTNPPKDETSDMEAQAKGRFQAGADWSGGGGVQLSGGGIGYIVAIHTVICDCLNNDRLERGQMFHPH